MDRVRAALLASGLTLIAAGALALYSAAGLSRWFAFGVLAAGLLLFAGLAVVSFAGASPFGRTLAARQQQNTVRDHSRARGR